MEKVSGWIKCGSFPKAKKSKLDVILAKVSKTPSRKATYLSWAPKLGAKAVIKTDNGEIIVTIWNNDQVLLSDGYLFVNSNSAIVGAILEAKIGEQLKCTMEGEHYNGILVKVASNTTILDTTWRR